jgi:hypothetical protein
LNTSIALITVIESDLINIDSNNTHNTRLFEREAILSFSHWRNNAGIYKDIPIYAVCITKNTISKDTKDKFKELNVTYIESYQAVTESFDCGFYNKPLGCKVLEETLTEDILIHIDLDMYLMREPTIPFKNACMVYDTHQLHKERIHKNGEVIDTYNTCYMVTKRKDKIFSKWWDKLKQLDEDYILDRSEFDKLYDNLEYRKLEELSFDLLSLDIEIYNIPNSLFGETYTPLASMNKLELNNITFHHYHIYTSLVEYNWFAGYREYTKCFL